jgi:hypothetical protein
MQQVPMNLGSGAIFDHPVRPTAPGEHPEPWCGGSGLREDGTRVRQLPGWMPHREGAGCGVTHPLGSVLVAAPDKAGWSGWGPYSGPFYLGRESFDQVRFPRHSVDMPNFPGVPDESLWYRFMLPQFHAITGSITDAYRAVNALAPLIGWVKDSDGSIGRALLAVLNGGVESADTPEI